MTREIETLRAVWRYAAQRHPFEILAVVVLPDHFHCIWRLLPGDEDFPVRWRLIKTEFSRALPKSADAAMSRRTPESAIWQPRYWEHAIRDPRTSIATFSIP